jgi:hypothetical protein
MIQTAVTVGCNEQFPKVRKCRDSAHGCETIPFDVSCRPLDDDTHKSRSISFSPHLHENHVKSIHWQAFGLGVKGVAAATQKETAMR